MAPQGESPSGPAVGGPRPRDGALTDGGVLEAATIDGDGLLLPAPGGYADLRTALNLLDAKGIRSTGVSLRKPTLDNVFLELATRAYKRA